MVQIAVKRIVATVPVMVLVALIVFSLLHLSPGDPAVVFAGEQATPAQIALVRARMGLDQPFMVQFGTWIWRLLHGDLGVSLVSNVPVLDLIGQRIEPTLSLTILTVLWSVVVAVPLAMLAAWKRNSLIDRAVMLLGVAGFSLPIFVLAYVVIFIFAIELRWLPIQGYKPLSSGVGPWLGSLALPAFALGSGYVALISRIGRATLVEIMQQDYVRTARAKGAGPRIVLFRHALRNAAVPIVTVVGLGVGLLIGGAVVTESVFAIPGIGRLTADAILRRDYPVIQGVVLLFSFTYMLINLLIDLLYPVLDPRIGY